MLNANVSELLTVGEAADRLRLKASSVRAWILRRKIPYVKVGRLVRIRRADVEALIAESVVPARGESGAGYVQSNGRLNHTGRTRTQKETKDEREGSQFLPQQ